MFRSSNYAKSFFYTGFHCEKILFIYSKITGNTTVSNVSNIYRIPWSMLFKISAIYLNAAITKSKTRKLNSILLNIIGIPVEAIYFSKIFPEAI